MLPFLRLPALWPDRFDGATVFTPPYSLHQGTLSFPVWTQEPDQQSLLKSTWMGGGFLAALKQPMWCLRCFPHRHTQPESKPQPCTCKLLWDAMVPAEPPCPS
ncbi:hypothetical protein H2248_012614 [Termitomyces sp. 'cryptogamus']|nr:hypothetical protein H2248_012614 [Termitomyces sp. 'cryptogamus']